MAIGSLSFAQENYEVSKNNGYQMEQINQLNPEMEKAVSKFYTFENLEILFEKEYEKCQKMRENSIQSYYLTYINI